MRQKGRSGDMRPEMEQPMPHIHNARKARNTQAEERADTISTPGHGDGESAARARYDPLLFPVCSDRPVGPDRRDPEKPPPFISIWLFLRIAEALQPG